jgi:hypothetical protein
MLLMPSLQLSFVCYATRSPLSPLAVTSGSFSRRGSACDVAHALPVSNSVSSEDLHLVRSYRSGMSRRSVCPRRISIMVQIEVRELRKLRKHPFMDFPQFPHFPQYHKAEDLRASGASDGRKRCLQQALVSASRRSRDRPVVPRFDSHQGFARAPHGESVPAKLLPSGEI